MAQVTRMFAKYEALNLIPSTAKTKPKQNKSQLFFTLKAWALA
jgi:hypothetical protein